MRKLQKLEHSYREKRQQRLIQVGRILRIMEDEEREWKLQRTRILEKEASGSADDANVPAILILLVLGSPLWLLGCVFAQYVFEGWGY